jgi:hypothetical protein
MLAEDTCDDAISMSVLMNQWFAPTRLVVTFEKDGQGRFTQEDIDRIIVRDNSGKVVGLDLPKKSVFIANHQVRQLHSFTFTLYECIYYRFTLIGGMRGVSCISQEPTRMSSLS